MKALQNQTIEKLYMLLYLNPMLTWVSMDGCIGVSTSASTRQEHVCRTLAPVQTLPYRVHRKCSMSVVMGTIPYGTDCLKSILCEARSVADPH